ncbi:unnamed protein product [Acanthoscelides obtectus]|uniref:MPN domain-containing protein n=1 Tax=Acanthoscelides obtectus TaxID=200917 RepID=A0A9P0LP91_ACAOB|nr:unnamed protein product [Acanthoscelides obtectus]CAK1664533.1 MPN domain-containing protein CG4751 [Acanthoscelides obtectus]
MTFQDTDDHAKNSSKQASGKESTHRSITLQNLLSAGILEPGPGAMTIEYLGQKFVGDLLEDGKIRSQETDIVFASPSAWAIACKRFINPDKKSGCGWASVKYKGKKLDAYKNVWYKKKKEEEEQKQEKETSVQLNLNIPQRIVSRMMCQYIVVKHNTIANRMLTHDANTMIDCVPFSNLGKIQPFLVSLSTNAALLMDFHCHLTRSEVSGYLAGYWDVNSHNLQITHAFPCCSTKADRENAPRVEAEIARTIEKERLTLVGWYHSHPFAAAAPTLRDVDAQLDYQIKMKGVSDNSYTPCVGVIVSPYNFENTSLESSIIAYWVIPPPETRPNEYGRPMLMSYSVIHDSVLHPYIKKEMEKCINYYKKENDFVNFNDKFINNTCFIDKLKTTLISKFPRDESETALWKFIRERLGISIEEKDLLSIPSISKASQLLPPMTLSSNLMLQTDISNLLFNSAKFSSAGNLLGLPDPMAHSTLAANNMFLQSNLFKMQELLQPLSTSSPLSGKGKSDHKSGQKGSLDTKGGKTDLTQGKMDFSMPDLNYSKYMKDFSASDYISSLNKLAKQDFPTPYTSKTDFGLNFSKQSEIGEKTPKVPKMDYASSGMLDLSFSKMTANESDTPTDLSVGVIESSSNAGAEDKPLNLAGE